MSTEKLLVILQGHGVRTKLIRGQVWAFEYARKWNVKECKWYDDSKWVCVDNWGKRELLNWLGY